MESINSVLIQNFKSYEIIVIDDCSTDNTYNIIQEFLLEYPQHKYLRLNTNSGTNIAKNIGSSHASGDYLVFLDSDDQLISESSLDQIFEVIRANDFPKLCMFSCVNSQGQIKSNNLNVDRKISFKNYLRGKTKGEYLPVVERKIFNTVKFFEDIHGGEHLTWLSIARTDDLYFSSKVVRLYDDTGVDRMSHIDDRQYKRLIGIFNKDFRINFFSYLCFYRIGIVKVGIRIFYYQLKYAISIVKKYKIN
jgi:glycosyltransferase involved in cell wall biosynthesis